jgi:guanine deaminase
MVENNHEKYIKKALQLANENVNSDKGGPFGAIIIKNNEIIASVGNSVLADNDPTAHAEINAIRIACKHINSFDLSGCTIYSSCEPCPMCLSAIYWARIEKIYYCNTRQEASDAGFDDELIYTEIAKEPKYRKIPIINIPLSGSSIPFKSWLEKENKKKY